ncbi:hypothetical protein [Streptomyces sp. NPDC059819]|uniref:hypothetical protein n=1 Tax=Streptomyces sp. NPDC059819 TaxID=3346963 RepID=UPI003663C6D1
MVPASRAYATDLVQKIKQAHEQWDELPDSAEETNAGKQLAQNALSLAKLLQRIGVLTSPVFEGWKVVG